MTYLASDASERHGIVWAISDNDHPAAVLLREPNRAAEGTVNTIGLEISKA